jgi:N-acetyl-gamma-glutamylphosphate reductase
LRLRVLRHAQRRGDEPGARAARGGARIVDFSADFRLKDKAVWEKWYKVAHASPELFGEAVYGCPRSTARRIRKARLVANPGCYATAVQLALLPLVESDQSTIATSSPIASRA